MPLDISYAKVDTITSFSIPLAEAKVLVKNAQVLQYIVLKKMFLMSVSWYLSSVLSYEPERIAAMITHWIYLPVSFSL